MFNRSLGGSSTLQSVPAQRGLLCLQRKNNQVANLESYGSNNLLLDTISEIYEV
jgi:hypothetical protein